MDADLHRHDGDAQPEARSQRRLELEFALLIEAHRPRFQSIPGPSSPDLLRGPVETPTHPGAADGNSGTRPASCCARWVVARRAVRSACRRAIELGCKPGLPGKVRADS